MSKAELAVLHGSIPALCYTANEPIGTVMIEHMQHCWSPSETDVKAMELAKLYEEQAEAYDRTVCTGPMGRDGILPSTPRELTRINRNARALRKGIMAEAARCGITDEQMRQAFRAV